MNRTEYIGKLNALYVGEKNCLEELITAYDEKDKEIERLKKINEAKDYINSKSIRFTTPYVELDYITHLQEEIERLNKRIEDLNIINEEHRILNGMIRKELQQKENIIKEVREYIDENWISQKDADNYRFDDAELIIEISDIAVLFDILDKGKE